ncbi:hypothetical protein [Streptosporangium sp. NPDC049046]
MSTEATALSRIVANEPVLTGLSGFLKETRQEFTLPARPFPISTEPLGKI